MRDSMTLDNILLDKIHNAKKPRIKDIVKALTVVDQQTLWSYADKIREKHCADKIFLRGIIEFSNFCDNTCLYCGLNKHNKRLTRYQMSEPEIIATLKRIKAFGIQTVVLQSGETEKLDSKWLANLIQTIKKEFGLAVTLSVGESSYSNYKKWRKAGADRYLLKIETTDKKLYHKMNPGMSLKKRLRCSLNLKKLGYQNGSGILIGLSGQTTESIAHDILYFKKMAFDMIGIGVFIPHQATSLAQVPAGNIELTLRVIALTRIITRNAHLPATTAVGTLNSDYTVMALKAGANVIMPNFTPQKYRALYEIYPGKNKSEFTNKQRLALLKSQALAAGRVLSFERGDSFKKTY